MLLRLGVTDRATRVLLFNYACQDMQRIFSTLNHILMSDDDRTIIDETTLAYGDDSSVESNLCAFHIE